MQADVAELQKFAERYTAAWCSQAAATVAAFYSPRGSLRVNDGAPAVGRSTITQTAQTFMTAFPDLHVVMDDLRVQNDHTEYHWTLTGTNTGPGGTGRPVRISGFEIWQIDLDGLIEASEGHFDSAEYERQLQAVVQNLP